MLSSGQIEILSIRVSSKLKIFLTKNQGKGAERNEPGERSQDERMTSKTVKR